MYICIICSQLVGRPVCRNKIFGLHTSGRRGLPAQTHMQPRCSRTQMPCGSPIAHSRQDALVYACCCNGGRQELTCLFATALTLPITALTHIPLPSFFVCAGVKFLHCLPPFFRSPFFPSLSLFPTMLVHPCTISLSFPGFPFPHFSSYELAIGVLAKCRSLLEAWTLGAVQVLEESPD